MLKKWGVSNFKSIKEADIELGPLTIFTGTNSSGKSSFIQSILLIAQTLRNPNSETLSLKGPLFPFGTFDHFQSSKDKKVDFKFTLLEDRGGGESEHVCKLSFTNGKNPWLNYFLFSSQGYWGGGILPLGSLLIEGKKDNESDEYFKNINFDIKEMHSAAVLKRKKIENIKYVNISHFFPEVFYTYNEDKIKKDIENTLNYVLEEEHWVDGDEYEDGFFLDDSMKYIDEDYKALFYSDKYSVLDEEGDFFCFNKENILKDEKEILEKMYIIKQEKMYNLKNLEDLGNLKCLEELKNYLSNYFSYSVKYLGPLRFRRSLHPFSQLKDPKDVGISGKYTASVINRFEEEEKHYPLPDDDSQKEESIKFNEALNKWLQYLGVAYEVKSNQVGIHGYELKARLSSKDELRDLTTQIGTGVSQILPIITMCLLADNDSTVIIEQPEEQLHPKIQSKLADFFIAMALNGRQCIIETHSEYLIEQLRFRILEMSNKFQLHEKTRLYFVKKRDGISYFENIEINKYAEFDEWPEDFFDESHKIAKKFADEAIRQSESGD